jgi:hypothetical protein
LLSGQPSGGDAGPADEASEERDDVLAVFRSAKSMVEEALFALDEHPDTADPASVAPRALAAMRRCADVADGLSERYRLQKAA